MTLTTINLAALGQTVNLGTEVTGTLPTGNGGTGSTATTFVNAATNVTGTLATTNGGTGATSFAPGKLLQTQSALFTSQSAHNSETFTASNYTDQITPSATSSKILVQFNFRSHVYQASGTQAVSRLAVFRQINGGGYTQFFPANAGTCWGISVSSGEREFYGSPQISFLDTTHNTTNAIDYKLYARRSTSASGSVNVGGSSHQAQVILMEISA